MGKHSASNVGGWHVAGSAPAAGGASVNVQVLRRNDLFIPGAAMELTHSGVGQDGGSGDTTRPILERLGSFDARLFAIPEIIPVDGTIINLGFYTSSAAANCWCGVFTDKTVSGNHYPDAVVNGTSKFNYAASGAGASTYRSGGVTIPVTKGQIVWFVSQQSVNTFTRSARHWRSMRPIFGVRTASPLVNTSTSPNNQCTCHGFVTAAAVAYDPTLNTYPAGASILTSGQIALGAQTVDLTTNRPSVDYQLSF